MRKPIKKENSLEDFYHTIAKDIVEFWESLEDKNAKTNQT